MKQQINEVRRMQQLAGIIKEFVNDIHPDDEKMDRIDMLLTRYVSEELGTEDYDANDSCIGPKWRAIADEFMKKELKDITDHPIKDAIKAANFKECLRGSQLNEDDEKIVIDPELYKQCEEDRQWYLVNSQIVDPDTGKNKQVGPMTKAEALEMVETLDQDEQEATVIVYKGMIDPFLS